MFNRKNNENTSKSGTIIISSRPTKDNTKVLQSFASHSRATMHCLVRQNHLSGDASTPLQRIVDAFNLYRLDPPDTSRISIVTGDLSLASFGLPPPEFERLAGAVDCVFHVGAHVNWLLDYLKKHSLLAFVLYRFVLGFSVIAIWLIKEMK